MTASMNNAPNTSGPDRRTSAIWSNFTRIKKDGRLFARCNLCSFELRGNLAGNAKKHLSTRHGTGLLQQVESRDSRPGRIKANQLRCCIARLNETVRLHPSCRNVPFQKWTLVNAIRAIVALAPLSEPFLGEAYDRYYVLC